ncbi:CaiB/BaiF CoA transferase family protein [Teichococcus aestuarii]|uniref:CaiB/BaiF CoA transferase family protein n=1 Tax=Teichococcus aestuarii TaxID=568898 RepID=UPI0036183D93
MSGPLPLAGLRVLEFSHTIMGPCAGLLLADMGADVVKVEPAPDGDRTRRLPGFAAGFFATFNRNKRSIALDLKHPEGRATLHRLVADADIVLENYGPGTMERLGCGWEDLHRLNPRLIYLALKGYLGGPYGNRPALDEVVQFQSGLAYMTGPPGQPLRAGASVIDILGAVFGVTGVLAALRERERTGEGQRVGSALFESAAFLMGSHIAGGAAMGEPPPPMPARRGAWGIYDVFQASCGTQLFIGVTSDAQWERFCAAFGLEELAGDPRLATNAQRVRERAAAARPAGGGRRPGIRRGHAALRGGRGVLVAGRQAGGPAAGPPSHRQRRPALHRHRRAGRRAGGAAARPAAGVRRGAQPRPLRRQPPRIGEHTREVLLAAGLPGERIAALQQAGVLADAAAPARLQQA